MRLLLTAFLFGGSADAKRRFSMNRRSFLETSFGASLSALVSSDVGWAAGDRSIETIGLQLYTVRNELKHDFENTLARVAEIGYREVEFAGLLDHSPRAVRAALDGAGLAGVSSHADFKSLGDPLPKILDGARTIGQKYIVCPWIDEEIRKQPDGWKHAAETFNRAGEVSQKAGIQFAYHNHWFEFLPVNGKLPYDILLEECDPKLVKMELDLCWITLGGQDPVKYFDRYPGRFPLVHVKDLTSVPPITAAGEQNFGDSMKEMTEVGSGVIDWKRIFAHSEKAGIKHYFVEHDNPKAPFDSIRTSYQYLERLRF